MSSKSIYLRTIYYTNKSFSD